MRVFDLVEQQEERRFALFLGTREDVIERGVSDGRSIGDDALVAHVGRKLVELLSLVRPHGHALLACKREKRRERRFLRALRDEDAIDAAPRLQRLEDGVPADKNLIGRRRIAPLFLPPVAFQGRPLFLCRPFLLLLLHRFAPSSALHSAHFRLHDVPREPRLFFDGASSRGSPTVRPASSRAFRRRP